MSDQSTLSRPLDEAKQALARRDMREARNLLTPMVKEDPAGIIFPRTSRISLM